MSPRSEPSKSGRPLGRLDDSRDLPDGRSSERLHELAGVTELILEVRNEAWTLIDRYERTLGLAVIPTICLRAARRILRGSARARQLRRTLRHARNRIRDAA